MRYFQQHIGKQKACVHVLDAHFNVICPDIPEIVSAIELLKTKLAPGPDNTQP